MPDGFVAQMCYIDLRSEDPAKLTMSTTTIRMDDALKARIAAAAERAGKSSHAFILDVLSETVERIETDNELHRIADERWVALKRTGESVAWADAKEYLRARASGKKARRPSARQPAR
jgi:predicted transcriptional regulator